jgi:16S rRNA (adenine1518-N6/adenine1519-N6)-dimethyltransferase
MVIAKKSLGQNFLMHAQTAERIVGAARLPENATVLEIGPGTGMLTRALLAQVGKVIAVEADEALAHELQETFANEIHTSRLSLINGDIREFDPSSLSGTYHVVANIPYYITGEIIRQFLSAAHKPESMTVLVQKEVAERIARNQGKESLLSISVKVFGTPEYCFTVPRGAFKPAPNVDSAVLSIRHISETVFPSSEAENHFFTVLRTGFAHKRKRLAKNLEEIAPAEQIQQVFEQLRFSFNVRPEEVSVEQWKSITSALAA